MRTIAKGLMSLLKAKDDKNYNCISAADQSMFYKCIVSSRASQLFYSWFIIE